MEVLGLRHQLPSPYDIVDVLPFPVAQKGISVMKDMRHPLLVDLFAELPDKMLIRVKEMLPETSMQEEESGSTVMSLRKAS